MYRRNTYRAIAITMISAGLFQTAGYAADAPPVSEGLVSQQNVYQGLDGVATGSVKRLRIIAYPLVPPGTVSPASTCSDTDMAAVKCVIGTVPVAPDGSTRFRVLAGVPVSFQVLNAKGEAEQTMHSFTRVPPGQTLACIGCHKNHHPAPAQNGTSALTSNQAPEKITCGPIGSWPFRYDTLVQPVIAAHCIKCHNPERGRKAAAKINLAPNKSQATLLAYDEPPDGLSSLFSSTASDAQSAPAKSSPLLKLLQSKRGHYNVRLDAASLERLIVWIDVYGRSPAPVPAAEQDTQLDQKRKDWAPLLIERP